MLKELKRRFLINIKSQTTLLISEITLLDKRTNISIKYGYVKGIQEKTQSS